MVWDESGFGMKDLTVCWLHQLLSARVRLFWIVSCVPLSFDDVFVMFQFRLVWIVLCRK